MTAGGAGKQSSATYCCTNRHNKGEIPTLCSLTFKCNLPYSTNFQCKGELPTLCSLTVTCNIPYCTNLHSKGELPKLCSLSFVANTNKVEDK